MTNATTKLVRCMKCDGAGTIEHLRHVDDGVCFACDGTGVVEGKPRKLPTARHDWAQTLRNMYRSARRPASDPCHCSYELVLDERDGMGWTAQGLSEVLDMVPGSRDAFRALGWPV
jgi:hypothetical protein